MSREDVAKAIAAISAIKDYHEIVEIYEFAYTHAKKISRDIAKTFSVGDRVRFDAKGTMTEGVVHKISRTTIIVETQKPRLLYRISPTLLQRC